MFLKRILFVLAFVLTIFAVDANAQKGNKLRVSLSNVGIGKSYIPIDVNNLKSGTYIYSITLNGIQLKTNKIIIAR